MNVWKNRQCGKFIRFDLGKKSLLHITMIDSVSLLVAPCDTSSQVTHSRWCSPRGQALVSKCLEAKFYRLGLGLKTCGWPSRWCSLRGQALVSKCLEAKFYRLGLGLKTCGLVGDVVLEARPWFRSASRPNFIVLALASRRVALALVLRAAVTIFSIMIKLMQCIKLILARIIN